MQPETTPHELQWVLRERTFQTGGAMWLLQSALVGVHHACNRHRSVQDSAAAEPNFQLGIAIGACTHGRQGAAERAAELGI